MILTVKFGCVTLYTRERFFGKCRSESLDYRILALICNLHLIYWLVMVYGCFSPSESLSGLFLAVIPLFVLVFASVMCSKCASEFDLSKILNLTADF